MSESSTCKPTEAEIRAFVGPRADKYLAKWGWYIERGSRKAGTLWPPFFFNFAWFMYRRMYREMWIPIALALGVGLLQGIVEGVVEGLGDQPFTTPRPVEVGIQLTLGFTTSWLGSFLYLRKLRRSVEQARRLGPDPVTVLEHLRTSGGTSRFAALCGSLLLALNVLVGYALAA